MLVPIHIGTMLVPIHIVPVIVMKRVSKHFIREY